VCERERPRARVRIHTHAHKNKQTHTQTHKHTNSQTHKHTNTQTHKHTNTQTRKRTHTNIHTVRRQGWGRLYGERDSGKKRRSREITQTQCGRRGRHLGGFGLTPPSKDLSGSIGRNSSNYRLNHRRCSLLLHYHLTQRVWGLPELDGA
jgi:hypothetical protein